MANFRINVTNNSGEHIAIPDRDESLEPQYLWRILTSPELGNWEQVEIELHPGNTSYGDHRDDQLKLDSSKTLNRDQEFENLKDKLKEASNKYNCDSKLTIRFCQPLRIRNTIHSSNSLLTFHSAEVR